MESTATNPNGSTGPKTPEGKAISSQNALKHGLRSTRVQVPPGMEEDFTEMRDRYRAAFLPHKPSPSEEIIFESFLKDAWNIFRLENHMERPFGENRENDALNRYEPKQHITMLARLKASYNRNLKMLQTIQTNQLLQKTLPEPIDPETLPPLAIVSPIVALSKQTGKKYAGISINHMIHTLNNEKNTPEVTHQS